MKYYFQPNDINCYGIQYHLDYMEENCIDEMEVFEAKAEFGTGMFFCKQYGEFGEVGGGECGKSCDFYAPRNRKSGRCRHSGFSYEQTEKSRVIKKK